MRIIDIINKKKKSLELTQQEIEFFINGYICNEIPDYQIAALLMAICFNGMTNRETKDLTLSMVHSGDIIDLSHVNGITGDKHSTGGVGDTTTLIVAPIAAACGIKFAKMSGRGLGHTGGTLDKLESIPGFQISQNKQNFLEIVEKCGLAIIGQTKQLVPADKKLYALRDVTSTIDSIPLIAASIMSKKIAAGADNIILDVKSGTGAFMQNDVRAKQLAEIMVDIGKHAGKNVHALVTDMNQPLGNAIGNTLEVQEALEILQGYHAGDLRKVSLSLTAELLVTSGIADNTNQAWEKAEKALTSGNALELFACMIKKQGGNPSVIDHPRILPQANIKQDFFAQKEGYVKFSNTREIGNVAMVLGAGRLNKTEKIDPTAGIWLLKRNGNWVEKDEPVAAFYANDKNKLNEAAERFSNTLEIMDKKPHDFPLIKSVIVPSA